MTYHETADVAELPCQLKCFSSLVRLSMAFMFPFLNKFAIDFSGWPVLVFICKISLGTTFNLLSLISVSQVKLCDFGTAIEQKDISVSPCLSCRSNELQEGGERMWELWEARRHWDVRCEQHVRDKKRCFCKTVWVRHPYAMPGRETLPSPTSAHNISHLFSMFSSPTSRPRYLMSRFYRPAEVILGCECAVRWAL